MDFGDAGHVLGEHLLLGAGLADLDLHEEVSGIDRVTDFRYRHLIGEERNRCALRVMRGERGTIRLGDHLVKRGESVLARKEHPRGVIDGDERIERVGGTEIVICGDLLAVFPDLGPEPVVEFDRRGEGLALQELERELRHREHDRIAAGFGILREDRGVGPERALSAEADAELAVRRFQEGRHDPFLGEVAALETERTYHRLTLELAPGLGNGNGLEALRSLRQRLLERANRCQRHSTRNEFPSVHRIFPFYVIRHLKAPRE